MEALLSGIISKLVDDAEGLKIDRKDEDQTIKYRIHVLPEDVGKVVGKKGQNINALRIIFKAIGAKELRKRIWIDIEE